MSLSCVIIEDHLMFLQVLDMMLSAMSGIKIVGTAQTIKDGVMVCTEHRPDILLLDLHLPDGDGVKVANALVKLNPKARILILSGQTSTFVCPKKLHVNIRAVIDKTQAYESLRYELESLIREELVDVLPGKKIALSLTDPEKLLTPQEKSIFVLIGQGFLSKEIADQLDISIHTVQAHRKKIATKLGTIGAELVLLATQCQSRKIRDLKENS